MAKRLTSDEIRAQDFTTTRLREGFAIDEVESFLNEVERTVRAHEKEITELRGLQEKAKSQSSKGGADPAAVAHLEAQVAKLEKKNRELESFKEWVEDTTAAMGGSLRAFASQDTEGAAGEGSNEEEYKKRIATLEAHLEEMAEELRTQDRRKATRIIDMAQTNAAQVIDDAEKEAERILESAKRQAQEEVAALESRRVDLVNANNELANLESENRERLRMFYANNLEQIESTSVIEPPSLNHVIGEESDGNGHSESTASGAGADNGANGSQGAAAAVEHDVTLNDWKPPVEEESDVELPPAPPVEEEEEERKYSPPVQQFPSFFDSQAKDES